MPRRNSGPRLRFLHKRRCYYITWTERGRSRERSTGTADRQQAEIALAEFIHQRTRSAGPRDPAETLITDILADYAQERGPATSAPWRIGYAIAALATFWEGRTVAEVTKQTCAGYVRARGRSDGTSRRELGVLRAAINYAHAEGRLTRTVSVHLPDSAEPCDRWLTREEAAALLRASLREPRVRLYLAAVRSHRALHGRSQGSDFVAALVSGGPCIRPHQFQCSWSAPDQQATGAHPDPFEAVTASATGTPARDRDRLCHSRERRAPQGREKGICLACRRAGLEGVSRTLCGTHVQLG